MALLDTIASTIAADEFMAKHVVFDVFGYFTSEELDRNKFIGVMRSKVVIDYMVQHSCIPRDHWRIVDVDIKSDRPMSGVGITSGYILPY